jgi:L-seryl-tRNA(Ser) seleniumtransferase
MKEIPQDNNPQNQDPRAQLPSVSEIIADNQIMELITIHSKPLVMEAVNDTLNELRKKLKPGDKPAATKEIIEKIISRLHEIESDRIRPVINATGIILHTGLGRAVLPENAAIALGQLDQTCNVQVDLETGLRGKRNFMVEKLLCLITGAEAAAIVNNNAAATFLILSALCKGKEVIISRGQLIEIGGSYRLPDCIHESGAIMKEVGTTNKTHLRDYEDALNENSGAILRCNPSNFRIIGFTEDVPIPDLAGLKRKHPVLVIDDLGCGALLNLESFGLPKEPTIQESLAAGADIVCCSGDKLIGGPQSGIILGKKELIHKIKKHPLMRMFRICKLTAIALEQTLRLFLDPETLMEKNPTLRMIGIPLKELYNKAQKMKKSINGKGLPYNIQVREEESATGGGSLPHAPLKTYALAVTAPHLSPDRLCHLLRQNEPPIIARIKDDAVLLDMRTLLKGEDAFIIKALEKIAGGM